VSDSTSITRREAVARTALLLGGTLAASSVAGAENTAWRTPSPAWRLRTLSTDQSELVATIAEHIIPATDTPGARAAGVDRFVDTILTNYYGVAECQRFLDGLADVDARALKEHGKTFLATTPQQQVALLTALDAESFPPDAAPTNGWFFRRMKELTLLGYYTSEVGAMTELKLNPMGVYRGDIPYRSIGHSWA
jgi:hypothetical protein